MENLRVLELYSGIGGMHYALKLSGISGEVVAAVDINPHANLVYKHNFKETKVLQKTIEGIKLDEFNRLNFDVILMSPPCQPFTRQGNQNGSNDNRAQSFLALIDIIPKLNKKPKYILMENVKGFDQDEARSWFIKMLKSENYHFQEFLLSPIQFGIPNSRLRYFLIARLDEPFNFKNESEISSVLPEETHKWIEEINQDLVFDLINLEKELNKKEECYFTENLTADIKETLVNEKYENCSQSESRNIFVNKVRNLGDFALNEMGHDIDLYLTKHTFLKSLKIMDLVTVDSTKTSCFTKNYGRYLEGTGSILMMKSDKNTILEEDEADFGMVKISRSLLRFFSPKEIANLHCFPNEFEFPSELTTIQKWKCIGNSLNVFIVAILIKLMIKNK